LQEDGGEEYQHLKIIRTQSNGFLTILTKHKLSNEKIFSEDEDYQVVFRQI
jgi:hypothetical protein